MPQIFHRSANTISRVSIFGAVFFIAILFGVLDALNRSAWNTGARVPNVGPERFLMLRDHAASYEAVAMAFGPRRLNVASPLVPVLGTGSLLR